MSGNDSCDGNKETIVGTTFVNKIITAMIVNTIKVAGYISDHFIFDLIF